MCLSILDFYDTDKHSGSAIEEAIIDDLRKKGAVLTPGRFSEALRRYQKGEGDEEDLWQAFKATYDEASTIRRIVLRFDTAELLEYEPDDENVLEDCGVEGLEAPALKWLLEKAAQLANTAIVIASRPNENLRQGLKLDLQGRIPDKGTRRARP